MKLRQILYRQFPWVLCRKMTVSPAGTRPATFDREMRMKSVGPTFFLLVLTAAAVRSQSGASEFRTAPSPSWVLAEPRTSSAASRDSATSRVRLLDDQQIRVTLGSQERYFRFVDQALTEVAIDNVSTVYFCFDPAFQSLVIHHLRRVRSGQTLDVLDVSEVIKSEDEEGCFVRRLTDVCKGDIVDYAYTLTGVDPRWGGRFGETFHLGRDTSTDRLRRRLLWPAGHKLYMRARNTAFSPSIRSMGHEVEYLWEPELLVASYSASVPSWFDLTPQVQLSDLATWQEVVRSVAPGFRVVSPLPPALGKQVKEWRAQLLSDEARLLAAVRFVQDEIKRDGELASRPVSPAKVLETRQGGPGDRALLLCSLLQGMAIDAVPALVNTNARHVVEEYQPSLAAFDSMLVRVSLAGHSYWFDPAQRRQRGPLRRHPSPPYARALLLAPGSSRLVEVPQPAIDASATIVREIYKSRSYSEPVDFQVATTFRGIAADEMRYRLSWMTLENYAEQRKKHYARGNPNLVSEGLPVLSDDAENNELTLTERYRLPKFWRGTTIGFQAEQIAERLRLPDGSPIGPLELGYPLVLRQIIEIHAPEALAVSRADETLGDDALSLHRSISASRNVVTLDYQVQSLRSFVAADKVPAHLSLRGQMESKLVQELRHSGDPMMLSYVADYWPFALFGVLLLIGLCLLLW